LHKEKGITDYADDSDKTKTLFPLREIRAIRGSKSLFPLSVVNFGVVNLEAKTDSEVEREEHHG
jgi:hypothetical protein